jgi:c-di-GMP-binding flagellar brake protein YcgR
VPTREYRLPRSERRRHALTEKAELLESQNQPATIHVGYVGEDRRKPRFKLAVDITIHSKSSGLLKGRTLDISEVGIAAVLEEDLPIGEVVKLTIRLASGPITIGATVRQRGSFFRYGFEFIESNSVGESLQSTCRQLAIEQSASGTP